MNETKRKFIFKLFTAGEEGVLISSLSKSMKKILPTQENILFRYGEGHQRARIYPYDMESLKLVLNDLYPQGAPTNKILSNKEACLHDKDAHRGQDGGFDVTLRSGRYAVELEYRGVKTQLYSYESDLFTRFYITDDYPVLGTAAEKSICIVENPKAFYQAANAVEASIYVLAGQQGGHTPEKLLDWLKQPCFEGYTFIHFGDYDPVGLNNYLRTKDVLTSHHSTNTVKLHIPETLEQYIQSNSLNTRFLDQKRYLPKLEISSDPDVVFVLDLIKQKGTGLDQEIFL